MAKDDGAALEGILDRYRDARGRIEVAALGRSNDEPLEIFFKPYNLRDDSKMQKYIVEQNSDGYAWLIVEKAEDRAGKKLFQGGVDAVKKLAKGRVPAWVLKEVATIMMASISFEDAEKKSEAARDETSQ